MYDEDVDRCSNGCVCTPAEQAEAGTHPYVITDAEGNILGAFQDEDERNDNLHAGVYPEDAEPAYVNG